MTFELTVGVDTTLTGGSGDDTFNGLFTDGGVNTFNTGDYIDGLGGTDTLNINPSIAGTAITLADDKWQYVTNIENIVFGETAAGVQAITTGVYFNTAFAGGVNLTTHSTAGAITLSMGSYNDAATLNTTSTAGAQTLTLGNGNNILTSASGAGAKTIVVGNGNNTIDVSGNTADVSAVGITVGSGNNAIILKASHTSANTLLFSAANAGSATNYSTVTNVHTNDTITFAFGAGVTTVTNDAVQTTLAIGQAAAAGAADGYYIFHDAVNTYIYENTANSADDQLVALVGVGHIITGTTAGIATLTS